jgi:hypothetical protein
MLIKETGTYRGAILDHGVGQTKESALPQWQLSVQATEKYDFETNQWVNWAGRQDCEITGYLCMFSGKGEPIFHVANIMEAVEWDGKSLKSLNDLALQGVGIQFVVNENTYNGETRLDRKSVV